MTKSGVGLLTITAILLIAVIFVPTVSAKENVAYKEDAAYSISPSIYKEPNIATKLMDTISQGETNRHSVYVGSGIETLEVYLNWDSASDSLSLTIYTPSGTNIGTLYDNSDGQTDGKIHIDITPGGGYVESGAWSFDVYGEQVASSRSYQFTVEKY
ncbi:peptidase [Methanogenium cariaci]|jgi:hypothetical protein